MKKLKAKLSFLAISLGLMSMPLNAALVNVPVVDGAWTFIGVPGFQSFGGTSGTTATTWPSAGGATSTNPIIIDAAGSAYQVAGLEVPTWDGNVTLPVSTSTAGATAIESADGVTPRAAGGGAGVGSNIYGTVAVMALGQDTTAYAKTSTVDHDGATIVALAAWTPMVKDYESPIRTMYVQSPNAAAPDIKIYYQARYENDTFLIEYETGSATALSRTDNVTYSGTFNHSYTYENAAVLGSDFAVYTGSSTSGTSGNDVSAIIASFDMNLSDNNMTSSKNDIQPNTSLTTFNGTSYTTSLRGTLDGNMTVLGWDAVTQQWRQFRATGDGSTTTATAANDFTDFTQGQGYWVKVDRDGGEVYADPAGFVLGHDATVDINHSAVITDGWNMLNFGDRYLSYSVTGILITPVAGAATTDDLNISDTYGATILSIDLPATGTPEQNCSVINGAIDSNNSFKYTNLGIRCIPTDTGLALLSTRRFTIQAGGTPLGLDGDTLLGESNVSGAGNNFYRSQYGNHAMIVEPNTYFSSVTGHDGNMSVTFVESAGSTGAVYAAVPATVTGAATNVGTAMGTAGAGLTDIQTNAVELDMNFDGTTDALLLGANHRFYVKDATLVRIFTYDDTRADNTRSNAGQIDNNASDNNTTARIAGKAVTVATDADFTIWDDNLSGTAFNINNLASNTEVNATKLEGEEDNTTIMIFYTGWGAQAASRVGTVDLQEQASLWDVMTETYCSSYATKTIQECNATTKGALGKIWNISTLTAYTEDENSTGAFDGIYSFTSLASTENVKNTAAFAENFPTSGPLYSMVSEYGVQPELVITGQTQAQGTAALSGTFISWKQIDASVPPEQWYDNDDQFELFWTEKEKGYWVYINGTATNDLSFGTPTIAGTPYAHFNNYFSGTSTTGTTRNNLNHTLTVTVNNLTQVGVANSNTDAYEVYASIAGFSTSLERDAAATNSFTLSLNNHETNGLTFDDGELAITLTAVYGSGKKVITNYTLDYEKPVISSLTLSQATVTVAITNGTTAASDIYVYSGDINDSLYSITSSGTNSVGTAATNWAGSATVAGDTTDVVLGSMTGLSFPTAFEDNSTAYLDSTTFNSLDEQLTEGLIRDVRIVAKDTQTLFSDQRRLLYVPVYSGTGILSDDGTDTTYDSNPIVYTTAGVQDTTTTTTEGKTYTGTTGGADDGVQMKSAVSGTTVSCVYAHQEVRLSESVANTKTLQTSGGTDFAVIMYMDEYIGKPFMCEVDGNIYVGGFVDADVTTADITMQSLSSSVSGISILKQ